MNICLLKCGTVQPRHLAISGDYDEMFITFFQKYAPAINISVFDVQKGSYPNGDNLRIFEGFLSTGSPNAVYDDENWIKDYKNFTKKLFIEGHKHVGICFGNQMIAEALGGKVEKSERDWGIGVKTMAIHSHPAWMNDNNLKEYKLIVSHQDQVIKLPENAEVIAGNNHCPVGLFTIDKHILGIQQHPEFNKKYILAIIDSRRDIIKPELITAAQNSIDQEPDTGIVAKWIENFYKI